MRTALVGAGYAAQALHLPAVRSLPGGVIVGAADPSPQRRADWERETSTPTFETTEEMLSHVTADLVVVASPPEYHAAACQTALAHGAHVLCEKPFVETLEQADAVLEAARKVGRQVAVNQEFRYLPIFAAVHDGLVAGRLGRPVFVQCTQFMDLAPWEEKVPWRAAMTDRSLFEGGVHIIDLVYWLMGGRKPVTITATTSSGLDASHNADAIHLVTMMFDDGAVGQVTINRLSRTGTRYIDVRVDCERGTYEASHGGRMLVRAGLERAERPGVRVDFGLEGLAWEITGTRRRVIGRSPRRASSRATANLYAGAVDAMRANREPPVSGLQASDTLQIIRAAYQSASTGMAVEVGSVAS